MTCVFKPDEDFAHEMDRKDPLQFRDQFYMPDKTIYMDGNSLGLLSKDAEKSLLRVVTEWKTLGIKGWLEAESPWFYYAENLGSMAAK
ncbi:MAG: kynureninase, partial [Theionarchaea archaeon]|nr:kynureninase [Theionarchaea archaeon]